MTSFAVGQRVRHQTGRFVFEGRVADVFYQLTGDKKLMLVVESDRGELRFYRATNLEAVNEGP